MRRCACLNICTLLLAAFISPAMAEEVFQPGKPISKQPPNGSIVLQAYPEDPLADIPWSSSCSMSGVADVQCAFNAARAAENSQLGRSIPDLAMPSQATWDNMTDAEKALWLINRERLDRGIDALHGIEVNVGSVAQYYARYLLDNNAFSHTADGLDPWQRLNSNAAINACHDFLSIAENLAVFWTSGTSIPLPVERSVYMWMYDDGDCCSWGHRHAILWYPYNDNSGIDGVEGFLGIGRASGPHMGWNFAEIIVMNVFDPCSTWVYDENVSLPFINLLLDD